MCFESIRCILRACECIMRVYWFISNVCKCFLEICNCVLKAYEFILKAWKCILKAYEFDFKTYEYILRPKECIWYYCVKSVRTRSYSDPHFSRIFPHSDWIRRDTISPYSVQMRENAGKMRTRITPNTDSFLRSLYMNIVCISSHDVIISHQAAMVFHNFWMLEESFIRCS